MRIKQTTIVFPVKGNTVLLGMKKRGFGAGWWNGFGGKLEPGESFEDSAKRETMEEVGLRLLALEPAAFLVFYFEGKPEIANVVYVSGKFSGKPRETEEMRPQWFTFTSIPFDDMWPDDRYWVPQALDPTVPPLYMSLYLTKDNEFIEKKDETHKSLASFFV